MLSALIVLRTLVVAGAFVVVARRAGRERVAAATWRSYRAAFALLTAASTVEAAFVLVGHPVGAVGTIGTIALRLSSTAACFFLYQGVAQWNRTHEKSRPAGRVDLLIGVSCILGAAGVVNLFLDVHPSLSGLLSQTRLLHVAALAVALSAVLFSALTQPREVRARSALIAVGVFLVLLTQVVYLVAGPVTVAVVVAWAAWMVMAGLYSWLALLRPLQPARWHPRGVGVPAASSAGLVLGLAAVVGAGIQERPGHWALGFGAAAIAGSAVRLVRLVRDLADHDRALRQAGTDDLTGLANRREFTRRLTEATTAGKPSVLLLDLDRFKEVNDQHGHAVGDELLARIAVQLELRLPADAVLARLGGDEFAVILPAAADAVGLAGELVAAVASVELVVGGGAAHRVEVSTGVAISAGTEGVSGAELLRRADSAMYAAKNSGLGVALHDDAADRAWRERVVLSDELHAALGVDAPATAADAFEVHYQPQVDRDDRVVGVEALVRWQHPRLGLLAPGAFLEVLEERGLMPALTVHVARRAVADLADWHAAGHPLRLSINTSSTYLSNPDLLRLLDELTLSGANPADVVVEVTETSLMRDPERALATCQEITARGFDLSIDDFGTGYSSLAYLAHLPASEVKVDRTFTSRAVADDRIAAIVAGTVELAHHLGLRVVAEGVEDEATLDLLRRLGCDESQGYLHSRPVPAEEFLHWLAARELTTARV